MSPELQSTQQTPLIIAGGEHVEEVPWTPPNAGNPWGVIETEHGPMRVVAPRGRIPGTTRYDAPPEGPKARRFKKPVPTDQLEYWPHHFVDEHPTQWTFPASLDNPNCRWLQALKRMYAMPIAFPASLSPEAGLLIHSLVRNIRPRVVIETGTFIGMSTMWIASALAEAGDGGVVHTFDDFSPIEKGPWRDAEITSGRLQFVAGLLAEAGLAEHVVMHPGNSSFEIRAAHEELRAAGGVQLAFLDADHGFTGVCQDLWATEPVLNTGGFVFFHDTFPEFCSYDGPRRVLDQINKIAVGVYEKVDLYLSPMNYGLAVIRRLG